MGVGCGTRVDTALYTPHRPDGITRGLDKEPRLSIRVQISRFKLTQFEPRFDKFHSHPLVHTYRHGALCGHTDLPVGVAQHVHEPIEELREVCQHVEVGYTVQDLEGASERGREG